MRARALERLSFGLTLLSGMLAAEAVQAAPIPVIYGDADGSGVVDANDRDEALAALLGTCGLPTYAVSNDSEYTIKDILMISQFGGGAGSWTEADLDGDGTPPVAVAIDQGDAQSGAPLATLPVPLRIQATWRSITGLCNNPSLAPAWFNRDSDTTGGALLDYNAMSLVEHNNVTVDGAGLSSGVSLILGTGEGSVAIEAGYEVRKAGGTTVDTTQTVFFTANSVAPCGGDTGDALQVLSYSPATSKWTNTVTGDSLCVVYDESLDKTATEATCSPFSCTVVTTTVARDTVCFNIGAGTCGDSGNLTWTATACEVASGSLPGSEAYRLSDTPEIPPAANARGGVGGGYLDGAVQVCVVDAESGTSLAVATEVMVTSTLIGNTYQTGTNFRDSIAAAGTCVTLSHANIAGPLSVTAAAVGYKVVTIADIDARVVVIPMERRSAAKIAEASQVGTLYELTGSINLASLNTGIHTVGSTYAAPTSAGRHGHCQSQLNPNPTRGVIAALGFKDRPLASLTIDDFQSPKTIKSIRICDNSPITPGITMDRDVPGNLIAPDFMYNGHQNTFSRLLSTAGTDIPIQVFGLSVSAEWADPTSAVDIDFDQLDFYVTVQDMALIDVNGTNCPGNVCDLDDTLAFPNAGEFNLNPASGALGYGYSFSGTCPSGHGSQPSGKCYWEKHRLNWDLDAEFVIRGVQSTVITNTIGSSYMGNPVGPAGSNDWPTNKPVDPDYPRRGTYFCDGAQCDQGGDYQGFLMRDIDGKGRKLDALFIYGMQVTAGLLGGYFLPINFSLGGEVHCPPSGINGSGNTCYGWMPLGGPTQSAMETYINNMQAGAVTASQLTSLATWFKKEPRGSGHVADEMSAQAGPNPINPTNRSGDYVMHAWGTDEVIGLPHGLEPPDPGAQSEPAHCIDSPTPGCKFCSTGSSIGKSCRTGTDCGGGTCTTITQATGIGFFDLGTRDFIFNTASPSGVNGSFNRDMRLARHDLSVKNNCFDTSGQLINTVAGLLACDDPAWSVYTNGPGTAGGAVTFKLPDITGMGDTVTIPDWRYVLGTGAGDLGAGFAEVDNYQYKQCAGGSNPNTSCTFKPDACLGGGTCTNITNATLMSWSQTGVGGNSLQSCATINNWHYSQSPGGGNGGFIDSDFFSNNRQTLLYNDN